MSEQEAVLIHFRRLKDFMREDYADVAKCMQGELLEEYRTTLKKEENHLKKIEKIISQSL